MGKRLTRQKAIREFCLQCMGFEAERPKLKGRGIAAADVKLCTCPNCPLYRYRLGREEAPCLPNPELIETKNEKEYGNKEGLKYY